MSDAPLEGIRVIESAILEPSALGAILGSLGADVIKVESPGEGDYARQMAWPFVDGVSLLHWHCNRAKRSIALDLRKPEGVDVYLDLVRGADVVVEGMRAGALARRGLTFERMREANPRVVLCTLSGFGMDGPYRDMPSHGIGFDAWAGVAPPKYEEDGSPYIPDHTSIGVRVGPFFSATAILAAVIGARSTGQGSHLDVAQADVAAAVNWLVIETHKAYERPEPEVTGNPSDGGERRLPGVAGMRDGVRYQYYRTADGHILFMASEREFWRNFCEGVGRNDLFEAHPGAKYADHARGDHALRRELAAIFGERSTQEWVQFGLQHNTPISPVNDGESLLSDPHFQVRLPWMSSAEPGADLMPMPLKVNGQSLPVPRTAPGVGEHAEEILSDVLGYGADQISRLRARGAFEA